MSEEEKEARHLINVLEDKKFTAQGEALRTYIEELNKKIDKLQKENEELKNADLTSVYMKGFYDSESKWKTKIKAKIKELEKNKEKEEYIDEYGVRNIPVLNGLIDLKIEVLKELLGDDE